MTNPVSGLINPEESILFGAYYGFTSGRVAYESWEGRKVTQAYFFRSTPEYLGSYIITAGLEQVIAHIKACEEYTISPEMEDWLRKTSGGDMTDDFLEFIRLFKPKFNIWAIPEGTPVFNNEPSFMIEGHPAYIQMIEDAILTGFNHPSLIATKASRMREACGRRAFVDFGARRAHGMSAGLLGARAGYIGGTDGTSLVLAGYKFGIPYVGTIPHAFIQIHQDDEKSFSDTEYEAFSKYAKSFPHNALLLVDTYNSVNGIMNAVAVGRKLKENGYALKGIRLDSGNLLELSKLARQMLDGAGLHTAKIYVSDNIDEYKITQLLRDGAPIDGFGIGTMLQTGANVNNTGKGKVSALGGVLKVVDVDGVPSMKFTNDIRKTTLPSKQQVWRLYDQQGMYYEDHISMMSEKLSGGEPLLKPIMVEGKIVYDFPNVKDIREYSMKEIKRIMPGYREIYLKDEGKKVYPVRLSPKLEELRKSLIEKYNKEFKADDVEPNKDEALQKYLEVVDKRNNVKQYMRWAIDHNWENVL